MVVIIMQVLCSRAVDDNLTPRLAERQSSKRSQKKRSSCIKTSLRPMTSSFGVGHKTCQKSNYRRCRSIDSTEPKSSELCTSLAGTLYRLIRSSHKKMYTVLWNRIEINGSIEGLSEPLPQPQPLSIPCTT